MKDDIDKFQFVSLGRPLSLGDETPQSHSSEDRNFIMATAKTSNLPLFSYFLNTQALRKSQLGKLCVYNPFSPKNLFENTFLSNKYAES
jgi:hypothetical protein